MKKKTIALVVAILCMCLLTGCQCQHEWLPADCTTPKICSLCNETEGEPAGHNWEDATCTAPKTCTICRSTEGERLPHTWIEANYQDPKSCSGCSITEGKPLEADFEKYGLTINMQENKHYYSKSESASSYSATEPYAYIIHCNNDISQQITAETYICDYRIFESDANHPAKEGYEWRAFDLELTVFGKNATIQFYLVDYYTTQKSDDSEFDLAGTEWDFLSDTFGGTGFMVNYHGEEYPCAVVIEDAEWGDYGKAYYSFGTELEEPVNFYDFNASFYACVPVGYDGVVVALTDMDYDDNLYFYEIANENTLSMRMDNTVRDWG